MWAACELPAKKHRRNTVFFQHTPDFNYIDFEAIIGIVTKGGRYVTTQEDFDKFL